MNDKAARQVWIHVGLPKTGTSAVQSTFAREREGLRRQGLLYPHTGEIGGGHARLAWPLLTPERQARGDILEHLSAQQGQSLWEELRREIEDSPCRKVFISTEYLSEVEPKIIAQHLHGLDAEVRILVYLRRQDELIESGYNQQVKAGLTSELFRVPQYLADYDYEKRLATWAAAFGRANVTARRYDTSVARMGVVQDIGAVVGVEVSGFKVSTSTSNPSLHPAVVEVQRLANLVGMTSAPPIEALQARLGALPGRSGQGFLTSDQRREILQTYAESNATVARDYFDDPDGQLFAAPDAEAADVPREIPDESLPFLLALLMWQAHTSEIDVLRREIEQLRRQFDA